MIVGYKMPRTNVKKHSRKGTKGVKQHSRSTSGISKVVPHSSSKKKSHQIAKALRLIEKREELLKNGFDTYSKEVTKVDDQIWKTLDEYDIKMEYWKKKQKEPEKWINEANRLIPEYEQIIRINPSDNFITDRYDPLLEDAIKVRKQQQSKLKTMKKRVSNYKKAWDTLFKYADSWVE